MLVWRTLTSCGRHARHAEDFPVEALDRQLVEMVGSMDHAGAASEMDGVSGLIDEAKYLVDLAGPN